MPLLLSRYGHGFTFDLLIKLGVIAAGEETMIHTTLPDAGSTMEAPLAERPRDRDVGSEKAICISQLP